MVYYALWNACTVFDEMGMLLLESTVGFVKKGREVLFC